MIDDMPQNENLKTTIINGRYVSSALIWRSIMYGWRKTYETYVWEYDEQTKERGRWLHETYQRNEDECLRVHDHMVRNFAEGQAIE
jgi:hypothetical protein